MNSDSPPLLRYFGGKYRDAHRIIAHFPEHEFFCEVFGGGASVLLQKPPAEFEVYNDLSGDVVNFFRVLRDRPMELIGAIELTPYSRMEFNLAYQDTEDELERDRRLYIRSWQSYSSDAIRSYTTLRKKPENIRLRVVPRTLPGLAISSMDNFGKWDKTQGN